MASPFRATWAALALLALGALGSSSACSPSSLQPRGAVVIFNDTQAPLGYRLLLSARWTDSEEIDSGSFRYVFEYDGSEFPSALTGVEVLAGGCRIALPEEDLQAAFQRDPEGRNTWDLHVDPAFLRRRECVQSL